MDSDCLRVTSTTAQFNRWCESKSVEGLREAAVHINRDAVTSFPAFEFSSGGVDFMEHLDEIRAGYVQSHGQLSSVANAFLISTRIHLFC